MRKKRLPPRHHSPSEYRSQPRHLSQVAIAPEKLSSLRHRCCSTPRERRLIKFKFRKRTARVARFRRLHCCRCNLILEFRNKKTATELRRRRDFDLALIRSAAGVFASIVERACAGGHRACRRHVLPGEKTHRPTRRECAAASRLWLSRTCRCWRSNQLWRQSLITFVARLPTS